MKTYIIYDKLSKLCKIGKSKNPKSRLSTLSTGNLNLDFLMVFDMNVEKLLHRIFKDKKVSKECYYLSKLDLENIEELLDELEKV